MFKATIRQQITARIKVQSSEFKWDYVSKFTRVFNTWIIMKPCSGFAYKTNSKKSSMILLTKIGICANV